jgi:hypothetical protein
VPFTYPRGKGITSLQLNIPALPIITITFHPSPSMALMGWRHGSSGKAPALKAQSIEFKQQYLKKEIFSILLALLL